jgi:cytochrome c-type biogenesis protein
MGDSISIVTAFSAGVLSFFAPCILPLLPPYFAWLLGISQKEFKNSKIRLKIFLNGFLIVLGFSIVFVILGASAGSLGKFLSPYRLLVQRIGGAIIILFGLEFIGFLKLFKKYRFILAERMFSRLSRRASSLFIGITFAFAWTACFSPILGSILVLSSFKQTVSEGVILLSFYSLGLAIPFLLSSLFLAFIAERIKSFTKFLKWVNLFSSLVLIILGILLVSDNFYKVVTWLTVIL